LTRPALVLALLVAACARPAPPPVASFRNAAVPISSIALFDPARLDGAWREVAGYPLGQTCQAAVDLKFSGAGARLDGAACHLPLATSVVLEPSGPGRLRAGGVELWVLWVDADYRTLVLGTPSGRFAAILNRDGPIPADRLTAARRVLDFNGYDLARLAIAG
jgi:apolipoprotein D and lipocalin family protein